MAGAGAGAVCAGAGVDVGVASCAGSGGSAGALGISPLVGSGGIGAGLGTGAARASSFSRVVSCTLAAASSAWARFASVGGDAAGDGAGAALARRAAPGGVRWITSCNDERDFSAVASRRCGAASARGFGRCDAMRRFCGRELVADRVGGVAERVACDSDGARAPKYCGRVGDGPRLSSTLLSTETEGGRLSPTTTCASAILTAPPPIAMAPKSAAATKPPPPLSRAWPRFGRRGRRKAIN